MSQEAQCTKNIKNKRESFAADRLPNIGGSINEDTIKNFYKNAEIFVTGATGFIGKALIEKLLRSCEDLKQIYILLRPKRGLTSEQRHKQFIENPIFDQIRHQNPSQLNKITCIAGDIVQPVLVFDDHYKEMIINNVNIVLHVAATIRFNEHLRTAASLNVYGTQHVLDMCCQMKQLKSFVYVSTAFSNPNRKEVDEIVYVPHPIDKETFLNCLTSFRGNDLDLIADRIQGQHPNTYTLTKSIAESIVAEYYTKLPICIVRPSIVTGALREPVPGWVDNSLGITGIATEFGRGTIKSILGNQNIIFDVVPLDIVVNTIIAAAWENSFVKSNNIQVYNCTSGELNPITLYKYVQLVIQHARTNPSKYVMMYPGTTIRTNQLVHKFLEIFYHFMPALLFDVLLWAQGDKPIMMKIARKSKAAVDATNYFTTHDWQFKNNNMLRLSRQVRMTDDSDAFDCTMAWDWNTYIETYVMGIRKFILKDDISSMEGARLRTKRLLWAKRILQFVLLTVIYYFTVHPIFKTFLFN